VSIFPSFAQCWSAVQSIAAGTAIAGWSAAGQATTTFDLVAIGPTSVTVLPANRQSRNVPRSDFEKVYNTWDDYKTRKLKRYELGFTQHSVYIISIFHHIGM
jgi:hypothetical protein